MNTSEYLESNVRYYSRVFPTVFKKSYGCYIEDEKGNKFIDFFSGAGALNYGHNNPKIKDSLINYLLDDGISHSLDMATVMKNEFMQKFNNIILKPRQMKFKMQFCGPTGTNVVEAAIKLARKVTNRHNIIAFTNAFHGMTLGALSVTGSSSKRLGASIPLPFTTFMPYDGYFGESVDTIEYIDRYLSDTSSGVDAPAAFIIESIQAEGGVNVASFKWLEKLQEVAIKYGALLIIDDIQVGCGRTGEFFSFEKTGIKPDIICLSKSLSGYGLPLSLMLLKPEHDKWNPGEHNGTFRGNNLAFVTATAALDFWSDDSFKEGILLRSNLIKQKLTQIVEKLNMPAARLRGRGLIWGVELSDEKAKQVSEACFYKNLIIETSGAKNQVIKFLPPLNIELEALNYGLDIIETCIFECYKRN